MATINLYIDNLLCLRAEKTNRQLNQSSDDDSRVQTIDTLTVLEDVRTETVRDCCSLLGYYLRLECGLEPVDFGSADELTPNERQQYDTLTRIGDFATYTAMCRQMIETVMSNGRRVFELLEAEKREKDRTRDDGQSTDDEPAAKRTRTDSVLADDLHSTNDLLRTMGGLFNRFHTIFSDHDCLPIETLYEKLFVSACLSERRPLSLSRLHLADLNTLTSTLTQAVVANTDNCNTLFEAFFGTGILFTALLNIITSEYSGHGGNGTHTAHNRQVRYWTRVRLHNEEDMRSVHFLKDVTDPVYRRTVALLPGQLFDPVHDVFLTKGDTLCTMFVQFLGRVHLRLYEWIERTDVQSYLRDNFVCTNVQTLFAKIGRGQDQRAWIRFFKRTNDRRAKVYIKLEPLLQLNDEIAASTGGGGTRTRANALMASTGGCVKASAPASIVRQYHMLRDFQERYDQFVVEHGEHLHARWAERCERFLRTSGTVESSEVYKRLDPDRSPVRSFESWCSHVNRLLFPYNFLLLTSNGDESVNSFDTVSLDQAWTYKCQEYMHFTQAKCEQMLRFLRTVEIKSRMFVEEKKFVMLFGDAMQNMPFLYDLVGEFVEPAESASDDVQMTEC